MNTVKSKKKLFVLSIAALFVIILLCWRLIPRSLNDMLHIDEKTVNSLYSSVTISRITDGKPYFDIYELNSVEVNDEDFHAIMKILSDSGYRPDFRNLLPWSKSSLTPDHMNDEGTAYISLVCGEKVEDFYCLYFYDNDFMAFDKDGFLIYHPTDPDICEQLVSYIKEHGQQKT